MNIYVCLSLGQTAARPEHVALRTRYERRNTIEAWMVVGSAWAVRILFTYLDTHPRYTNVWKTGQIRSDPHFYNMHICLLGRHLQMDDVLLLCLLISG